MDIVWHGDTRFTIKTKRDTITINHQNKESSITLFSQDQEFADVNPARIDWPGEYEINESLFTGLPLIRKSGDELTVFTMVVEEVSLCHLGNLDRKLTDKELEAIGNIQVLFVPVGGNDAALTVKEAKEVIEQIEPAVVIPMLYKVNDEDLAPVTDFLKEMGSTVEIQKKLNLSSSKISLDRTNIEVLEVQK